MTPADYIGMRLGGSSSKKLKDYMYLGHVNILGKKYQTATINKRVRQTWADAANYHMY